MPDFYTTLAQKASELYCSQATELCSNALLDKLACTLSHTAEQACEISRPIAAYCYTTLVEECPAVWLRQYALPVTIAASMAVGAMWYCNNRLRNR